MGSDIVFKTKAFGGFNKEEVMDFVNRILAEKSELEKRVSDANVKYAQANAQMLEYKKIVDESLDVKNALAEANEKLGEADARASAKDEEIEKLNNQICAKDKEIDELNKKLSEAVISDDVQAELDSLRAEVAALKIENDKKKDLERQVGAAMLDARIHSEELIEEAKEKANAVTKSVYAAIGETALKIDDLSGGIGEIARNFTKSVEEVELRIKALTGDMSKTAQLLISDTGYIAEKEEANNEIEYDFSVNSDVETEITINPSDYEVESTIEISDDDYKTEE